MLDQIFDAGCSPQLVREVLAMQWTRLAGRLSLSRADSVQNQILALLKLRRNRSATAATLLSFVAVGTSLLLVLRDSTLPPRDPNERFQMLVPS